MEDDDELTIDHLIGQTCVLNSSVEVTVARHHKTGELRLQTDMGGYYFVVDQVVDVKADGGFCLHITPPRNAHTQAATLITKKLFNERT